MTAPTELTLSGRPKVRPITDDAIDAKRDAFTDIRDEIDAAFTDYEAKFDRHSRPT